MYCPSLRVLEAKAIPNGYTHRPGGRTRRFRSSSCFAAVAGKPVCWEVSSRVSAASELLQHLFLDLLDFVSYRANAIQGAPQPFSLRDYLIDLIENVTKFGVEFDQRPRTFVAGLPGSRSGIAKLPGLVKQLGNFLFIAQQELADGSANLLVFSRVTPKHMLEKEKVLLQNFRLSFQIGARLE